MILENLEIKWVLGGKLEYLGYIMDFSYWFFNVFLNNNNLRHYIQREPENCNRCIKYSSMKEKLNSMSKVMIGYE